MKKTIILPLIFACMSVKGEVYAIPKFNNEVERCVPDSKEYVERCLMQKAKKDADETEVDLRAYMAKVGLLSQYLQWSKTEEQNRKQYCKLESAIHVPYIKKVLKTGLNFTQQSIEEFNASCMTNQYNAIRETKFRLYMVMSSEQSFK